MSKVETVTPELPAELAIAIEGKDSGTVSTLLSSHRTQLSVLRTGLSDLRSHLSNERTHLSYLRTSISLIGFGITLNRFSGFLQQQGQLAPKTGLMLRNTENVGSGMVVLGLLLVMWALYRYWHVNQDINNGRFRSLDRAIVVVTLLFILLGGLTSAWLFVV